MTHVHTGHGADAQADCHGCDSEYRRKEGERFTAHIASLTELRSVCRSYAEAVDAVEAGERFGVTNYRIAEQRLHEAALVAGRSVKGSSG